MLRSILSTSVLWIVLIVLVNQTAYNHLPRRPQKTITSNGTEPANLCDGLRNHVRNVSIPLSVEDEGDHTAYCDRLLANDEDDSTVVTCTVLLTPRDTTHHNNNVSQPSFTFQKTDRDPGADQGLLLPLSAPMVSVVTPAVSSSSGDEWLWVLVSPWLHMPSTDLATRPNVDSWPDTLLALMAIGLFALFCVRVVNWVLVSTDFGERVRQHLASAPGYVVVRSVAFSSAALVLCFKGTMQHLAIVLALTSHLVYRWALWYWRCSHTEGQTAVVQAEEKLTDVVFYASYVVAAIGYTYVFGWSVLGVGAVLGAYSLVSTVRQYRIPLPTDEGAQRPLLNRAATTVPATAPPHPIWHTGPAHRYWSALETVVPVTCVATLFLFMLPRGGVLVHLLGPMVVPITTWCPLFFVLLLVAHVNFRHRQWSYLSVQCVVLFFIGVVWATVVYHQHHVYSWHLLFFVLFCYAKLLDAYSRFELEWLHWTMSLLCCSVGTWYVRQYVV